MADIKAEIERVRTRRQETTEKLEGLIKRVPRGRFRVIKETCGGIMDGLHHQVVQDCETLEEARALLPRRSGYLVAWFIYNDAGEVVNSVSPDPYPL